MTFYFFLKLVDLFAIGVYAFVRLFESRILFAEWRGERNSLLCC